jgi:hypothetical protein
VPDRSKPSSQDTATDRKELPEILLLLLHGACFLLVVLYVNLFQVWAWLVALLGSGPVASILPVAVTLAVLLVIAGGFVRRVNRGYAINLVVLGLGMVGAFLALAIPDSNVPIKRIHVAEYIILSFLVRYTLRHRLQGADLTLFTVLVTLLLGIHDEMMQGLHSLRYYGWRDILVNGMAGLSGALLGHGLHCFSLPLPSRGGLPAGSGVPFRLLGQYLALAAATAWLVAALFDQRGGTFSVLSYLPLAAVSLLIAILHPEYIFTSRRHHGLQALWWLASALLLYPLLANWTGMEFI